MRFSSAAIIGAAILFLAACDQNTPAPGAPGTSATGLTGSDRAAFISSAVESCSAKQRSDPSNAQIPQATIVNFCTCYATKMADSISMSEMEALNTAIQQNPAQAQAMMQPRIEAAQNACVSVIRGG